MATEAGKRWEGGVAGGDEDGRGGILGGRRAHAGAATEGRSPGADRLVGPTSLPPRRRRLPPFRAAVMSECQHAANRMLALAGRTASFALLDRPRVRQSC